MSARAVLYSDLNCPFCYALDERLHASERAAEVEWRGVEHSPELPVPMAQAGPALAAELAGEAAAMAQIAPELELTKPAGKPNTRRALLAAAAALRADPERGHAFKLSLHRAFWQRGADLSDPNVLGELALGAGIELPADEAAGEEPLSAWRREWEALGVMAVPLLVAADGRGIPGLVDRRTLEAFLDSAG